MRGKVMADPQPHEEYLHQLGTSDLYRRDLAKALKISAKKKEGKLDIDDLIDQIMAKATTHLGKHYPGADERYHLTREDLADLLQELKQEIEKEGGLDDDTARTIAANYVSRANQLALTKYGTKLRMLPLDQAKESVKRVATFTGNEHHHPHIAQTQKYDTLVTRVQTRYHEDVLGKTTEMVRKGQTGKAKEGYLTFQYKA